MKPLLEACVETLNEAINAELNGAHCIELCSRLDLDGLTPQREYAAHLVGSLSIPVKVMIRPRQGNFVYSRAELDQIREDILYFKQLPIQGLVLGITDTRKRLNLEQIKMMADLASPLDITIHKAIDICENPLQEVERLKRIKGVSSILTSGNAPTALEGLDMIKQMMTAAGQALLVIAAGKISNKNLDKIHNLLGADKYHGRRIVGKL